MCRDSLAAPIPHGSVGVAAMILKGNQRGGGIQFAAHLLKTEDNEHVHVHELRGFMSDDLKSAFHEAYELARL